MLMTGQDEQIGSRREKKIHECLFFMNRSSVRTMWRQRRQTEWKAVLVVIQAMLSEKLEATSGPNWPRNCNTFLANQVFKAQLP